LSSVTRVCSIRRKQDLWIDISSRPCKTRSKHAEATDERLRSQGRTQKTHLYDMGQVDRDRLLDRLDPLQGLLQLHPSLGKIGLRHKSSNPKHVLELTLLLILKDELNLPRVLGAGPHQVGRP